MGYDFSGWATRHNLKCSDGRVIRQGAFRVNNGTKVPLIWNHRHDDPGMVLGHALLENRKEGVYARCKLNKSEKANSVREALRNGDVNSLSIWANNLVQDGSDVLHGVIREVSVVLQGANPGAYIESVVMHGMPLGEGEDEAIMYTGSKLEIADEYLQHSEQTIGDIYNDMTDEQKDAVAAIVEMALDDDYDDDDYDDDDYDDDDYDDDDYDDDDYDDDDYDDDDYDDDEDGDYMGHNIFEGGGSNQEYLSHAEVMEITSTIMEDAKNIGTLREALKYHMTDENGVLAHADLDLSGMTLATGTQTYGFNDPSMLFPDFKNVNGATPEWISRNMDWVQTVMNTVGRTPFSRIKSVFANITEEEARARGYIKGNQKKNEVFSTLKRTTSPQTVYKLQKLDRDDIVDIVDFDVIVWIRAEMRMMLNEEIARAILIGDGRQSDSEDKIQEDHIRPIANDVPLFNIKKIISVSPTAKEEEIAKKTIREILKARKDYKGSGNPTFYTTEDVLTNMLLLEDGIGHRLYKTEQELATALRVKNIETVEVMEGHKVNGKDLVGIIVNLADYRVGADKGGQINNFEDFDIEFNQNRYLIETRISGALVKPFSAITILIDKETTSTLSKEEE